MNQSQDVHFIKTFASKKALLFQIAHVCLEETEVLDRNLNEDLQLQKQSCAELRKAVQQMAEMKKQDIDSNVR